VNTLYPRRHEGQARLQSQSGLTYVLSTRSNRLRKPASVERYSNSAHTVRRLNESSHRHM
jgi:hypothetical protein